MTAAAELGGWMREARLEHGLTQQQLADQIGVHLNTLHGWEHGQHLGPVVKFFAALRILGVQIAPPRSG